MGNLRPVFGVFAVVAWLVLIGLHTFWHYSFGWLFNTLADLMDKVSIPTGILGTKHLLGPASSFLRSLDKNIDHSLVAAANNLEHTVVWLFSRVGFVFGWLGRQVEAVALGVEHAIGKLIRVTIPRIVTRLLRFVWRELRALGRYARKAIPKLLKQITRFSKWAVHEIAKGARHLGFLWSWVKVVIREHVRFFKAIWHRLKRLEHALVPKKFRGLVAGALKLLGLEWLFGTNIGTLAAWIIGFNPAHLREYITDAIEIVGTTDLCTLAAYQYDLAVFVFEPVMQELIGLEDWFCFHQGDSLPSATKARPGYLLAWAPSATPPLRELKDVKRLAPNVPLPRGVLSA